MESDSGAVTLGVARRQTGLPFNSAALNGNFGFAVAGASFGSAFTGLGQVALNGRGGLTGTEDFNLGGSTASDIVVSGTYSVVSSGSGSAAVTNASGTTPLRVMTINSAEGVFISADPNQPFIGLFEQQCSDCH
jgi:hypothetical protein